MPRTNERVLCKDCRFNIDRLCYLDREYGRTLIRVIPPDIEQGCFSGKPRVARSCRNCLRRGGPKCQLNLQIKFPFKVSPDWHCSDWEGVGDDKGN